MQKYKKFLTEAKVEGRRKEIAAPRPWEGSGRRYGWESLFLEGCEGEVSEPYPEGTESDEEDHGEGQR